MTLLFLGCLDLCTLCGKASFSFLRFPLGSLLSSLLLCFLEFALTYLFLERTKIGLRFFLLSPDLFLLTALFVPVGGVRIDIATCGDLLNLLKVPRLGSLGLLLFFERLLSNAVVDPSGLRLRLLFLVLL